MPNGCFGLDANGDMSLDANGNLLVVYNLDSIIQNVRSAVRLWLNEYEFNTKIGVNYKRYLGQPTVLASNVLRRDIINAIQSIQGVIKVVSLTYNYVKETSAFTGTAVINTIYTAKPVTIGF